MTLQVDDQKRKEPRPTKPSSPVRLAAEPNLLALQRELGNQAIVATLSSSGTRAQRQVVTSTGKLAGLAHVKKWLETEKLSSALGDDELEEHLDVENSKEDRNLTIRQFLVDVQAIDDDDEDESDKMDEDWDPADYAADPLDSDDILSSDVRKALGFNSTAKGWMKLDTPQKSGNYVCHICQKSMVKGQKVDMDHLPPWKERLAAFINVNKLTEDDVDELSGPNMSLLYNMRGSVFAHSSCNRGHSGEGNYKAKWGTAAKWYAAGGGAPF